MNQTLEDEFLSAMAPLIQEGSIELWGDETPFIELIEKNFPFVGSKIDWQQVPGVITKNINAHAFVPECLAFIKDQLIRFEIPPLTKVVVIGDGVLNQAIAARVEVLELLMSEILNLPQHTYIIELNGEWCMAFTMEGYADFGRSCKSDLI